MTSAGGKWIESCVWMQEDVSGFFLWEIMHRGHHLGQLWVHFILFHVSIVTKMGPWLASCGSFGQVQMCGGHVGGDRRQSWPFELIWKLFLALKVPMDGHFKVLSVKPEKKSRKTREEA